MYKILPKKTNFATKRCYMFYFTYKKGQVYTFSKKQSVVAREVYIHKNTIIHTHSTHHSTYTILRIPLYTTITQQKYYICYSHYTTALHTYHIYLAPNKVRNLRVISAKKRAILLLPAFVLLVKSVFISIVSNSTIHFLFISFHIL